MTYAAQTQLQLYRQLQDAAYCESDVILVDEAYRIAMRLFAGSYRPNNKPFLAHLVGVASILANAAQPAPVVAAGLLHSAYSLGLGRTGSRIGSRYRTALRDALGEKVEQLVYAYSSRCWSVDHFSGMNDRLRGLKGLDRDLYLIKIADLHEEFLDGGYLYQPRKVLLAGEDTSRSWLRDVPALIEGLGHPRWARDFEQAVAPVSRQPPVAVRGSAASSYMLAPGFFRNRIKDRLVRWLSRRW